MFIVFFTVEALWLTCLCLRTCFWGPGLSLAVYCYVIGCSLKLETLHHIHEFVFLQPRIINGLAEKLLAGMTE